MTGVTLNRLGRVYRVVAAPSAFDPDLTIDDVRRRANMTRAHADACLAVLADAKLVGWDGMGWVAFAPWPADSESHAGRVICRYARVRVPTDKAWDAHIRTIKARVRARKRTIERARRHLKALDECAVTLGVTRLRMLELASARPRAAATVARGVQR